MEVISSGLWRCGLGPVEWVIREKKRGTGRGTASQRGKGLRGMGWGRGEGEGGSHRKLRQTFLTKILAVIEAGDFVLGRSKVLG